MDPKELKVAIIDGKVYFFASSPANVVALEEIFPDGTWEDLECMDGRCGYHVKGLKALALGWGPKAVLEDVTCQ